MRSSRVVAAAMLQSRSSRYESGLLDGLVRVRPPRRSACIEFDCAAVSAPGATRPGQRMMQTGDVGVLAAALH